MGTNYKIVFTGRLLPGFDREKVIKNLLAISNMDRERAEKFLDKDRATVVQKNLTKEKAEKFLAIFQKAGLEMQLVPPDQAATAAQGKTPPSAVTPDPPRQAAESTTKPTSDGGQEAVTAAHGLLWLKSAATMFLQEPWKWMGMAIIALLLQAIAAILPFFGSIINSLLTPVFAAGMMMAAQNQYEGKPFSFDYIFKGFHHNRNQLLLVGAIYFAGIMIIAMVIGFITAIALGTSIISITGSVDESVVSSQLIYANIIVFLVALLFGLLLSVPLFMGTWFTAPLVALHDKQPWDAYKTSFMICYKNWKPFLAYSGIIFAVGLSSTGIVVALMFATGQNGSYFYLSFISCLILFVLGFPCAVICAISVFTSFHDLYQQSD